MMKYDPATKGVERTPEDRERHRLIRERLQFASQPTAGDVKAAVHSLLSEGLLSHGGGQDDVTAISHVLCAERARQGVSLAELSARTGLDEAAIASLEAGQQTNASVQVLTIWARGLGKRLHVHLLDS